MDQSTEFGRKLRKSEVLRTLAHNIYGNHHFFHQNIVITRYLNHLNIFLIHLDKKYMVIIKWEVAHLTLTELVHRVSLENLSLKIPEPVRVMHLVAPPRHTGHHVSEIIIIIIFNIIKSIHLHIILIIIKSKTIVTFQWDPTLHLCT